MTIVVGAVLLIANSRAPGWTIGRVPFWRDSLMLLIAVSVVLHVAADGVTEVAEALAFLALYVLYIASVLLLPKILGCVPPPPHHPVPPPPHQPVARPPLTTP